MKALAVLLLSLSAQAAPIELTQSPPADWPQLDIKIQLVSHEVNSKR